MMRMMNANSMIAMTARRIVLTVLRSLFVLLRFSGSGGVGLFSCSGCSSGWPSLSAASL